MSSQLFFRDKGKIWKYNVDTKGADSNIQTKNADAMIYHSRR